MELEGGARARVAEAAVVAHLPDAVVVIDRAGDVVWGNEAAERHLGRSLDAPEGLSGLDLIHPDDREQAALAMISVVGKTVGTPLELRIRTATGWRLAEVIGAPVRDGSETIVLSMRDLTERRRWEVAGDETAKLRALVHHASSLFILLDRDGCIEATSGSFTRILGHDQAAVERVALAELVAADDVPRLHEALERARADEATSVDSVRVEVRISVASDSIAEFRPYELSIVSLVDDPTVGGIVVTAHDVSQRTATEGELRETLSLLHATLDSTADGVLVVDLEGRVTSFNSRFSEMWTLPLALVSDGDDDELVEIASRQLLEPEAFLRRTTELKESPQSDGFDVLRFVDGRVFERYSMPQRVDGEIVGRVWSFHDVTKQQQLERQLEHDALHDSLTGLANQALFRAEVADALRVGLDGGTTNAVLYLDIDDFKRVNDSIGHLSGDELLIAVASRLRATVRSKDLVARLGGDEFAILVRDARSPREVLDVTHRLMRVFVDPVHVGDRELMTSVSVGIAFCGPGEDAEDVLRSADLAMYAAKRDGKSRYEVYAPEMHAAAVERLELEDDLRGAIARREFWVAYQPIVDLRTQRISGYEALARWQHPTRGTLGPDHFIGAAEDLGLIGAIGEQVLRDSCRQLRQWNGDGSDGGLTMSVNVSSRQLTQANLVEDFRDILRTSDVRPDRLVLEITETAIMQDTPTTARTLDALRGLGVRLALDDFGTGYSSLTHLQQFPIDIIKIDRSFMTSTMTDAALISGIVGLSGALGLTTVAEGIETAAQVSFLQAAGCEFGQGHFYARPMAASDLATRRLSAASW